MRKPARISYYTSKKEVVYASLMMCENAPPEWMNVPDENIKRFQKSIRYQRAEDKEAALEKFKIVFRKQRLWNEVLKVEKGANAQLGRSFEFSLPKEWSRMEQIEYATDFIQRNFVAKGMCADWSIHDKGDGNPHVHLLVTMRPFKKNHTWGNKEVKDWAFVRNKDGNIVIDETHPDWWQDKKNPERHGIRIPVLNADGNQKLDSRNRKQWKREVADATGWNNPKNCELWRSEWAKECNLHLKQEQQIDHRSYERQGKIEIPTIHEGAEARKIEEKYQSGQAVSASWKVEENRIIKKQNAILKKLQEVFGQVGILLKQWKERLNDIRRKQRSYSPDGEYDKPDRGTTGAYGRDVQMYQEMEQKDGQLILFQEQNQRLQELNNELQEQLQILPSIEELLELLEKKDGKIQTLKEENRMLKDENQQWKELAEKLNDENRLLQRQNEELLNCRTD